MLASVSQIFSFTFCTWRWNPCLLKEPFCIQPRCIWNLNAFAFSPVFIFCFVSLLCLINTFPYKEAKHSLCSVPLESENLLLILWLKGMGVSMWERQTESIFNHKDNSFSLTCPAAPERIWHLRVLGSKSNSYLSGDWNRRDWEQQVNCGGENESGIWGKEFRASKEEVIIYQQW